MKDLSMMVDDVKFNYRVGLIIELDGKVFVEVNPNNSFVTIPGGRVHTLEYTKETVIREAYEEMGIKLNKNDLNLHAVIENFFEMDDIKFHELYFLYKLVLDKEDKRFKDNMKNNDSKANYFKLVDIEGIDQVNILPKVLKKIIKEKNFNNYVVNDLDK